MLIPATLSTRAVLNLDNTNNSVSKSFISLFLGTRICIVLRLILSISYNPLIENCVAPRMPIYSPTSNSPDAHLVKVSSTRDNPLAATLLLIKDAVITFTFAFTSCITVQSRSSVSVIHMLAPRLI